MASRYDKRAIFLNQEELYQKLFDERHVKAIRHYDTATFNFPTQEDLSRVTKKIHIWKTGDRFYKLAVENYGAAQYWWVIALFNQTPTESHLSPGDTLYVPLPLENVLRVFTNS